MYSLSAFKSYDIRWVWQKEVDEEFAFILGYAIWLYIIEQYENPRILITSDTRINNIPLIDELLEWMWSAGVVAVDVFGYNEKYPEYVYGISSTPLSYYVTYENYDLCFGVSASHNDGSYAGIKLYDRHCFNISTTFLKERFLLAEPLIATLRRKWKPLVQYLEYKEKLEKLYDKLITSFSHIQSIPKITIDYGHGAAVNYEREVIKTALGNNVVELFTEPDGNFPAHETDTSRDANYAKLLQVIQWNWSAFGFMFDGDADRLGIILPNGRIIRWDLILAIIAKQLLTDWTAERLWTNIVYQEVFCGRIVRDVVREYWGTLKMCRVGRGVFAPQVVADNALVAGEISSHLLLKEFGMIEMPLMVLYYLLKEAEWYESFEAMIYHYTRFVRGQVYHFATDYKDEAIQSILNSYADYECITIDGVRVEMEYAWFCIRKSGTEPIIKLTLEADSQEVFDSLLWELRDKLKELGCHEE